MFNEELISAYLDGELTGEEQARVEHALTTDAGLRQMYDDLRTLRQSLQGLPRLKLDDGFAARVLAQAQAAKAQSSERETSDALVVAAMTQPALTPEPSAPVSLAAAHSNAALQREPFAWRALVWTTAALAASLLAALVFPQGASQLAWRGTGSSAKPAASQQGDEMAQPPAAENNAADAERTALRGDRKEGGGDQDGHFAPDAGAQSGGSPAESEQDTTQRNATAPRSFANRNPIDEVASSELTKPAKDSAKREADPHLENAQQMEKKRGIAPPPGARSFGVKNGSGNEALDKKSDGNGFGAGGVGSAARGSADSPPPPGVQTRPAAPGTANELIRRHHQPADAAALRTAIAEPTAAGSLVVVRVSRAQAKESPELAALLARHQIEMQPAETLSAAVAKKAEGSLRGRGGGALGAGKSFREESQRDKILAEGAAKTPSAQEEKSPEKLQEAALAKKGDEATADKDRAGGLALEDAKGSSTRSVELVYVEGSLDQIAAALAEYRAAPGHQVAISSLAGLDPAAPDVQLFLAAAQQVTRQRSAAGQFAQGERRRMDQVKEAGAALPSAALPGAPAPQNAGRDQLDEVSPALEKPKSAAVPGEGDAAAPAPPAATADAAKQGLESLTPGFDDGARPLAAKAKSSRGYAWRIDLPTPRAAPAALGDDKATDSGPAGSVPGDPGFRPGARRVPSPVSNAEQQEVRSKPSAAAAQPGTSLDAASAPVRVLIVIEPN